MSIFDTKVYHNPSLPDFFCFDVAAVPENVPAYRIIKCQWYDGRLANGKVYVGARHIIQTYGDSQKGHTSVFDFLTGMASKYEDYDHIPEFCVESGAVGLLPYDYYGGCDQYGNPMHDISASVKGRLPVRIEQVPGSQTACYHFLRLLMDLDSARFRYKHCVKERDGCTNGSTKEYYEMEMAKYFAKFRAAVLEVNAAIYREAFQAGEDCQIIMRNTDLTGCVRCQLDDWNSWDRNRRNLLETAWVNALTARDAYDEMTKDFYYDKSKADQENRESEKRMEKEIALMDHYRILHGAEKYQLLKMPFSLDVQLPACYLQRLLEDYLRTELEYGYNHERLSSYYEDYYSKRYGTVSSRKSEPMEKCFFVDSDPYVRSSRGCQKAFIADNSAFLGEYGPLPFSIYYLGVEAAPSRRSCVFTIRAEINGGFEYDIKRAGRAWCSSVGRYVASYIRQAHREKPGAAPFTEDILSRNGEKNGCAIIWEETVRYDTITVGALLESLKQLFKQSAAFMKAFRDHVEEEKREQREYDDWRTDDYISPRDYYGDDWE